MSQDIRIVHLVRHGEVDNPRGILYGRLPGYHLSSLGQQMAGRVAEFFATVPLSQLRCSPLERTQETIAPIAAMHPELKVIIEPRVIEAGNQFEGLKFGFNKRTLASPKNLWALRNPVKPSWGESFVSIAARMKQVIKEVAEEVGEHGQGLVVSHQLPIWVSRCQAEGRRLWGDPRNRECTLASVTSFHVLHGHIVKVGYAEPAFDLLPIQPAGPDQGSKRAKKLGRYNSQIGSDKVEPPR